MSNKKFIRPFRDPAKLIDIYRHIEEYVRTHGYPPSSLEMVEAGFGSSTSVVHYFFLRMEQEGMMEITPRIARGIRLLPLEDASERVREVVGQVE